MRQILSIIFDLNYIFRKRKIGKKSFLNFLIFITLIYSAISVYTIKHHNYKNGSVNNKPPSLTSETPTVVEPSIAPTFSPSPGLTLRPSIKPLKIIFGIGSQAGPAMDYKIVKETPMRMLTSWYNGTSDLEWMRIQENDLIPRLYKNNYIVHLITWSDLPEVELQTPYGPACGRPYPVSEQVVNDMRELARIYRGSGIMYVSLFTEFQTFTCIDNNWTGNENYWNTLKDNYRKIKDILHAEAPNSKVSLSWGGWQSSYDDQVNKGGRSLFLYFTDVIKESDFVSFQSMESDTNISDIRSMTLILGSYGKSVMLSHYKPANASTAVFENDLKTIFSDDIMKELIKNGLFAFSFMDSEIIDNSLSAYETAKTAVIKYGK